MSVTKIDDVGFRNAIRQQGVTLVEFGAKWCPPCKVLLPILDELQQEEGDRVSILQVDCDESPDMASQFGVMSMPTVIVFHNGEPVDKFIGLRPKDVYQQAIAKYV